MKKVLRDAEEAAALIPDGATIMMGGFGLAGIPENLVAALQRRGTKDLTIISNNAGTDDSGIGLLLRARQVRKMIATYVGENKEFERQFLQKEIEVELVPQGTFSERIRAGGAGIPAFYTPTGYGTLIAEGKETRVFDGRHYVLERALHADFAFVKAWKGDRLGNLAYRRTARNFNPMMATAAAVHDRRSRASRRARRDRSGCRPHAGHLREAHPAGQRLLEADREADGARVDKRERIIRRVARELRDGDYVNLGIGMPTMVANVVPAGHPHHAALRERDARRRARIRSRAKRIPIRSTPARRP